MAEIFRMPTIGEQLGPSLNQLGDTIANLRNPNRDIQTALRQAVAQNPDLLQKLVDMGPDKVGQIFGKQASFLGLGDISTEEQIKRDTKKKYQSDQTFQNELFAKATGTQTDVQRQKDALDITGKDISNKTGASQLRVQQETENDQIAQLKNATAVSNQKITEMQQAIAKYPDLGSIDIGAVAHRIASGRNVDPMVLQRLSQSGINFSEIVNSLQQQAQIAASFSLQKLREQSKEVKFLALGHIEKRIDDTRNKIILADNVIKSTQKELTSAKLFTQKPRPLDDAKAGMWDAKKTIVDNYEAATRAKAEAEKEYNTYNPVYNQLLDNLVGKEGVNKKDVAPPDVVPYIEAAAQIKNPFELKKFMMEFRKGNPMMYEKVSPYINMK